MATSTSLPSIKISKTSPAGNVEPITPVSDVEYPPTPTELERPSTSGNMERDSPKISNSGSFISSIKSVGDSDKPQSPGSTKVRKGTLTRESPAVDPVTQSILSRTGTDATITNKSQQRHDGMDDAGMNGASASGNRGRSPESPKIGIAPVGKEKKKGVSFLSRIMGNKKKGPDGAEDALSPEDERRTEGMDAAVFSQPIGYMPTYPAPPKYIRVHSHHKPQRDFDQMFLAQELLANARPSAAGEDGKSTTGSGPNGSSISLALPKHKTGAVWAMKFSKDGRYLAAAGQDKAVRIWQVLSCNDDRVSHEKEEDAAGSAEEMYSGGSGIRLNAPVFKSEPIQEYHGHTGDILDLSWSKNNFLLSSSMDKTVRLWHVTRKECLCCFQHSDFVTSIAFHPRDDRFFLAGSLDSKLRLWSILDKSVAFWNELPDLITAVAFTPDGRMAIAGCLNGLCLFYETEGLRYHTQLHVRSSHGRNAKGSKITGIETVTFPPEDPNGDVKILITSNDSRVRIYNARDKSLETKFKGYENTCSQIHATFSDDTRYIISGSEDRKVYIWNTGTGETDKKDKRPLEFFEAHPAIVTVAIMAPNKTKQLLGESKDPLYDLCNPPPVMLVSRSNSLTSSKKNYGSVSTGGDSDIADPPKELKPSGNPSWLARSTHPDGNIIVTADYTGRIKIFRQDCAATKRKNESWETGSVLSKRIGTGILRKGSVTHSSPDRIMSWRQSIGSITSLDGSSKSRNSIFEGGAFRHRSISPKKSTSALSTTSNGSKLTPQKAGGLRSRAQSLSAKIDTRNRNNSSVQPEVERHDNSARESLVVEENVPDTETKPIRSVISSEDEDNSGVFSDGESDGEAVRCKKCSSTSFKAKHNRRGEHKLVCVKCNTVM